MSDSWRRRCLAAEERAAKAERALARAKAKLARADVAFSELTEQSFLQGEYIGALTRTLRSVARYHLGPDSSPKERMDLCEKWAEQANKRRGPEELELVGHAKTLLARFFPDRPFEDEEDE